MCECYNTARFQSQTKPASDPNRIQNQTQIEIEICIELGVGLRARPTSDLQTGLRYEMEIDLLLGSRVGTGCRLQLGSRRRLGYRLQLRLGRGSDSPGDWTWGLAVFVFRSERVLSRCEERKMKKNGSCLRLRLELSLRLRL